MKKKWTKAERVEASRKAKALWAKRRQAKALSDKSWTVTVPKDPAAVREGGLVVATYAAGGSGRSGSAPPSVGDGTGVSSLMLGASQEVIARQTLAIDVVALIARNTSAEVLVKVVERILRP